MYNFTTADQLLKLCKRRKMPISELTIHYEMARSGHPKNDVWDKMKKVKNVMQEAINKRKTGTSAFGMGGGNASKLYKAIDENQKMILDKLSLQAMAYALSTCELNSCMGRIVAFPTAGGSGIIPGCVFSLAKEWDLNEETIIRGLFNASAIGLIIAQGATLSAAAGGCQAEVGAATAMAASAITEMRGGTVEQCFNSAALALKNKLGLACDPLGGLVAVPCIKRNSLGVVHSFGASDLSMAGVISFVPFDEVIVAMKNICDTMPMEIRETALGGLAITKTGLKIRKKLGLPKLTM